MSYCKYKNYDIDIIYPPPPCPPLETDCLKTTRIIKEKYNHKMKEWREGFNDWILRREEDIIKSRFDILDLGE